MNIRKILLSVILILSVPHLAASQKVRGPEVLAALEDMFWTLDSAYVHAAKMYNIILEEQKAGKEDVDSVFWSRNVVPHADACVSFIDEALKRMDGMWPKKIKDGFWSDLREDVCSQIKYNARGKFKDSGDLLGNDYLQLLVQAPSYTSLYLTIFNNGISSLKRALESLLELYDVLDADESVLWKEVKKEKKQDMPSVQMKGQGKSVSASEARDAVEKEYLRSQNAHGSISIQTVPGIFLGHEYSVTKRQLLSNGYRLMKESTAEDIFYGPTKTAFFRGEIDGHPVSVQIDASSVAVHQIVHSAKVIYSDIIDEIEAKEEYDGILAEICGLYPDHTVEGSMVQGGIHMVETASSKGRTYRRIAASTGFETMVYVNEPESTEQDGFAGSISLRCLKELSSGFLIEASYHDSVWGLYSLHVKDFTLK